jgi:hypothetical protein
LRVAGVEGDLAEEEHGVQHQPGTENHDQGGEKRLGIETS